MKNRIDSLFQNKKENILSVFFTAGFPQLRDTLKIVESLDKAGVDMIEIGIPFSDPLADGKVIQQSSSQALANGMSLSLLFSQLENLRNHTDKPVLLMGYLNAVLQFGVEKFYQSCHACGVDGVILPDLPIEEFEKEHKLFAEKYAIHHVFLLSPLSLQNRIDEVKRVSGGFIYLVSANATTGNASENIDRVKEIMPKIGFTIPVLIGFGINNHEAFKRVCSISQGAIIGSEYIRRISSSDKIEQTTLQFINEIKNLS
ncbi:MAG: tryptophan synthase subunit alpha [Crocinitomicaceae bacterium]|nr:tryptophan synthase subunit alpha [Crocinitomicaceae bacterium]